MYKYGFNGKEKDPEGMGDGSSTYDYGFRIYNPWLGKFLSMDPLTKSYPWYTPYQFAGNMPIVAIDLDGMEEYIVLRVYENENLKSTSIIFVPTSSRIEQNGVLYFDLDISNQDKIEQYFGNKGLIHKNNNYEQFINYQNKTFKDGYFENELRPLEKSLKADFEDGSRKINTEKTLTHDALVPRANRKRNAKD